MNSIGVSGSRITLQRITINRKAKHQGSSKPAEFAPNGMQVIGAALDAAGLKSADPQVVNDAPVDEYAGVYETAMGRLTISPRVCSSAGTMTLSLSRTASGML